ncbi:MAG: hypothetical protein ACE5HB_01690 [Terriglobia bacterium]
MKNGHYLLLRASATHLPLRDNAVSLVLATPPYLGERSFSPQDCCTPSPDRYARIVSSFLDEAARIVRPGGHILLSTTSKPLPGTKGRRRVLFEIFRKARTRNGRRRCKRVDFLELSARFAAVKGYAWQALPVWLYEVLLRQYSEPGETFAHVFSGSGNAALAAFKLSRRPILVDLHYHSLVRRRLNRRLGPSRPER